jgi:hypothetical protein
MSGPIRNSFIFVGGAERSGTTLVNRLLHGHPEVHCALTDYVVFDRYDYFRRWTGMADPEGVDQVRAVCERMLENPFVAKWGLTKADLDCVLGRYEEGFDAVYLTLVYALAHKHPDCRLGFKHPTSESHFAKVKALLEAQGAQVRFLYCIRSPFDVYLSWRHRASAWNGGAKLDPRPVTWSAQWLSSTMDALACSYAFPSQMKVMRYEDLLDSPKDRAGELCEYLGLPQEAERMIASLEDAAPNSSFAGSDGSARGVVDTRARKKAELSDFERNAIRVACAERAALFGYGLGAVTADPAQIQMVKNELALQSIPTAGLISASARLIRRRIGNKLFSRDPQCKPADAPAMPRPVSANS